MSVQDIRRIKYDLTGQQFGMLTVLSIDNKRKDFQKIYWTCQCECGKITSVTTSDLKSGKSTSCGCTRVKNSIQATKKYNNYDLSNDYGIGYATNTENVFYFDKEDYEIIKQYAWREMKSGYFVTTILSKNVYLHRLIMDCQDDMEVDHINHNKFDNRRSNLRICTHQQNNFNKQPSYNASGYKGIMWDKRYKKWRPRISVNNKEIYLGLYKDLEEAIEVRKQAEIKYFKDYRYKGDN